MILNYIVVLQYFLGENIHSCKDLIEWPDLKFMPVQSSQRKSLQTW